MEVNRTKKVIILERVLNQSRAIVLINAAESDQLNFNVECTDSARIKLTLLVCDRSRIVDLWHAAAENQTGRVGERTSDF